MADVKGDVRTAPAVATTPQTFGLNIADPGPLGLAAFALTTFVLSCYNAGLMPASTKGMVFGLAFFYGGIVQILAGVLEFFKNNVLGGVAFCSFGSFWLGFHTISTNPAYMATAATEDKAKAVGLYLVAWSIFTAYMTAVVSKTNTALFATFVLVLGALIFLAIGDLMGSSPATTIGGYLGLAAAFGAWYCSFAGIMNTVAGRVVLPIWPRGAGH